MLNDKIFLLFCGLSHKSIIFDNIVYFTARIFPFIVLFLAILFLLFHHEVFSKEKPAKEIFQKLREIFFVSLSVVSAWLLAVYLKIVFQIPRPFLSLPNIHPLLAPTDFSFPSGHSAFFMGLATAIFLYHKKVGYWFVFFAFLIGISRIIAGVHYPLDILGGFLFGALGSFLLIKTFKKS